MIYVQSIASKTDILITSRFYGMWGVSGISNCMSRWRGPMLYRCLHSWKFDWRILWIFHYLSIFTQISVIVPPEGMVIINCPTQMFVLCPI